MHDANSIPRLYSIHATWTFNPNSRNLRKRLGLSFKDDFMFYHLEQSSKWFEYMRKTYSYKLPFEIRRNFPKKELIEGLQENILSMPEPLSYCAARELIMETDMPMGADPKILASEKVKIFLFAGKSDNYIVIPTRIYLFNSYLEPVLNMDFEKIKEELDYIDLFSTIRLTGDPIDIFSEGIIIRQPDRFLHEFVDNNRVRFKPGFDWDSLPTFFNLPISTDVYVTASTKLELERAHVKGIDFRPLLEK